MEARRGEYEVFDRKEQRQYIINLEKRDCNCGYWQLSGIPCVHVVSSLGLHFRSSLRL